MLDMSLERTIRNQWHGIAEMAEQLIDFIKARRAKARPKAELITSVARAIDWADDAIAQTTVLIAQFDNEMARIAEFDPPASDQQLASLGEIRKQLQDQASIIRAQREQWFEYMVQFNPEDAWVWTPEGAASLRRAEASVAAGRVISYQSDEEFLAALKCIHTDAHA